MIDKHELYLDSYDRQVGLAPGLLVLLPLSITIAVLGLRRYAPVSIAIGVLASAGGPALLADLVRERGHTAQDRLYKAWGGMPTTRMLRTREATTNVVQRDKWRAAVGALAGVSLPSKASETRAPAAADAAIESAVDDIRDQLRDKTTFKLLYRELRTYGYRRNMRGIRPIGVVLAGAGVALALVVFLVSSSARAHPESGYLSIVVDVIAIAFWAVIVRDNWVKKAADRYGFQLMQAAVQKHKS